MSNNYRVLLHFLNSFNDIIRITTGLRGNPHLYNLWKKNVDKNFQIKFNPQSELNQIKTNINLNSIIDDVSLVAEGLRQYTNYVAKNGIKNPILQSQSIPFDEITKTVKNTLSNELKEEYTEQQNFSTNKRHLDEIKEIKLSEQSKERKVPANRISRVLSFGNLAFNLSLGAAEELTKRIVGISEDKPEEIFGSNLFLNKNNAIKIVDTLCRVRGAALKLGQILSIQDNEMISPELQSIFERVRQSADYMPEYQLVGMLKKELGLNWQVLYKQFDLKPFAAASIGQVHKAQTLDDSWVAVKVQYPGVAESIESDIRNVMSIVKYANIFPKGLFIDHIMNYARKELNWEVDYVREAECQIKYRQLINEHSYPNENLKVPIVYKELSTKKVLTTELISGIPVDKMNDYAETSNPRVKNSVMERILRLFFRELLLFNYMQTDPNWSNFFYDYSTDTLSLIDFGSCRPFSKEFVEKYKEIINAAIENDRDLILKRSEEIGFLVGYETETFKNAHVDSVLIIGEVLRTPGKFDFGKQSVIKRINAQVPLMLKHRLKPPPEEIYSLHRKLSGLFLLCCRLKCEINCRDIYEDINKIAQ